MLLRAGLAFGVPWHRDRGGNPREHFGSSNLVEALQPPHAKSTFGPCLLGDHPLTEDLLACLAVMVMLVTRRGGTHL